jgi:D-sedoheptulose 7-phosphate isomerase
VSDHIKGAAQSSVSAYLGAELDEHAALVAKIREAVADEFVRLVSACSTALRAGNKLLFLATEGVQRTPSIWRLSSSSATKQIAPALAAMALTTDTSALTAIGNDFGFDALFARQLEALCRAGDIAIGISTSGNSENVIRGLQAASAAGAVTVAFAGEGGGRLAGQVDVGIFVPSRTTARIQEMHLLLGHTLCALLERDVQE